MGVFLSRRPLFSVSLFSRITTPMKKSVFGIGKVCSTEDAGTAQAGQKPHGYGMNRG